MGKAGPCRMRSRFRRRVFDGFSTGDFSPRATEDRQCGKICQWLYVVGKRERERERERKKKKAVKQRDQASRLRARASP